MNKRGNLLIPAVFFIMLVFINCGRRQNNPAAPSLIITPTTTATGGVVETRTETPASGFTITETPAMSESATITKTSTPEHTKTYSATVIITGTFTITETYTPTLTASETVTDTATQTMTCTPTPTITLTDTPTFTATATFTSTSTETSTSTNTATATVTPGLHVKYSLVGQIKAKYWAIFMWIDINATGFTTHLRQNNDLGLPVSAASIDCDGNLPAESGTTGNYKTYTTSFLYSVGQTVNSSIVSGIGTTSSHAVMPEAAAVTWPGHLATLNTAVDNTVSWTYPAAVPVTVSVIVADSITDINQIFMNTYVPGTNTSYTIPAGTLPPGLNRVYLLVGGANFGAYPGVEPNTNTFSVHNMHGVVISTQ
jgi:hypothetical protein